MQNNKHFEVKNEYLNVDIENCGFSPKTLQILKRNGITTLFALIVKYNQGMVNSNGAGDLVENEVYNFLCTLENPIIEAEDEQELKRVLIDELDLSTRTYNVLKRAQIDNLSSFLKLKENEVRAMRNAGNFTVREIQQAQEKLLADNSKWLNEIIEATKEKVENVEVDEEDNSDDKDTFLEEMSSIEIWDLALDVRGHNCLKRAGINTVKDFLLLTREQMAEIRNLGNVTAKNLLELQNELWQKREEYFSEHEDKVLELHRKRDFDITVINDLKDNFGFSLGLLCDWFGVTRQRVYQKIQRKRVDYDVWTGKVLNERDLEAIRYLIENKTFETERDEVKYYFFNNRKDNLAFLCVSSDDIKCFYLSDMPEEVRALIEDNNFDRFTIEELEEVSQGEEVYILTKPHYKPNNVSKFRALARNRNMTLDEYAMFLKGMPYYAGKNITDKEIIEFFEDNLVDGKVYISSDPSNQWIRSYVSRNGYSMKEFIELYGFETAMTGAHDRSVSARLSHAEELKKYLVYDNVVYLDTFSDAYRLISVYASHRGLKLNEYIEELGFRRTMIKPYVPQDNDEADMEEYDAPEDAKLVERIYAQNPLLGNYVFSEKNLEKLNKNAKLILDKFIKDSSSIKECDIRMKLQLTLAVINYAKKWTSETESSFWSFIAGQFGYRDSSNEVRDIICRCVEESMSYEKRLFITDFNGKQYKSTIVVHALTTKRTWMYLFDFLFDFYRNNLNWSYVDNDPSIGQMIHALSKKFSFEGNDEKEAAISISSEVYRFQEGIKKLVLYRPKYAEKLFSRLIKRIDELVKQEAAPAVKYEEVLADEWLSGKMQRILETRTRRNTSMETKVVAISYERIKAIYQLENEQEIKIVLPDIRLKEDDVDGISLLLYNGEKLVYEKALSYYGNELGRTIRGVSLDVREALRVSGTNQYEFSVIVKCGNNTIYDSENSLHRILFVFDKKNEINASSIGKGNYTVIIPYDEKIEIENASVDIITEDIKYGKAYYVQLKKDFVFTYRGEIIAIDNVNDEHIKVLIPNVKEDVFYIKDGLSYKIAGTCDTVKILMSETDIENKYVILCNGERISFADLNYVAKDSKRIYTLPLESGANTNLVQVLDLSRNKLITNERFKLIDNFRYEFNRLVYFDESDYEFATFSYALEDETKETVSFSSKEEAISVDTEDGELNICIPKIMVYDSLSNTWGPNSQFWIDNIDQNVFLTVETPYEIDIELFANNLQIYAEYNGTYGIGNAIHSIDTADEEEIVFSIKVLANGDVFDEYVIGRIILKEKFVNKPILCYENKRITWNNDVGFLGNDESNLSINISSDNGFKNTYALNLDSETIVEDIDLEIGEYKFAFVKQSGNLFIPEEKKLAEGSFYVGNIDELRFINQVICINKVSFYDSYSARVMQQSIGNIYVDNIKFLGRESVSDDGELPIYTGTLFFINRHGERKEFSFENLETSDGKLMKVNPVRVALLNDSVLSLVDNEGERFDYGDGFYCSSYLEQATGKVKYSFTDKEYMQWNMKFYHGIDLYMYSKERIENHV